MVRGNISKGVEIGERGAAGMGVRESLNPREGVQAVSSLRVR